MEKYGTQLIRDIIRDPTLHDALECLVCGEDLKGDDVPNIIRAIRREETIFCRKCKKLKNDFELAECGKHYKCSDCI